MKNIKEIKDKLHTKEYLFLRTDPRLGDNLILLGLGGSHAYGTAIETSDLDIRGCALNTREEILLGRDFEQVTDSTTDTVIYSFKKLVTLLKNVNPNTIELLGLEPWQYLYVSEAGHELLVNKKLFLSKKCINSFGGYASQQLYRLNQLSKHSMSQEELEKHILKTLEFMRESFNERYSPFPDDDIRLYLDDSEQEGRDKEIFMDVRLTHYPLRDYSSMWNELQNTVSQYGKLGTRDRYA
ncbi:MAG: nucleotidyltransferase domain-containing protein, partial [Lachnospiraceae bacterium]|nr:nucleotidyltransferase domain-containing protein [Lachnospiraceae bacterium]